MTEQRNPWSRRDDENAKNYAMFIGFRDMGPFRTIKGFFETSGIKRQSLSRRCQDFDWWERAEAWDAWLSAHSDDIYIKAHMSLQAKAVAHVPALLDKAVDIALGKVEVESHAQVTMLSNLLDRFGLGAPKKVIAAVTHHVEDAQPDLDRLTLDEKKQWLTLMERMDEDDDVIDVEHVLLEGD